MEARSREIENGKYFLGQSESDADNILHIAVKSKKDEFIQKITKERLLPRSIINNLMNQSNKDGDTPLHVAAKEGNVTILNLLLKCENGQYEMKNANGCTPFHVALINHKIQIARVLVNKHDDLVEDKIDTTLIKLLVDKDRRVACWRDNEGYTPLHRASFLPISFGLQVIKIILESCQESAKVVDKNNDETILHLMINRISSYEKGKELLQIKGIADLLTVKNKHNKIPLRLAMKLNFQMVKLLKKKALLLQTKAEADLEQQLSDFDKINEKKKKTTEEFEVVPGVKFQFLEGRLTKFGMNFLSSTDSKGRNVLHNLMQLERGSPIIPDKYFDFVKQVVDSYPTLVFQLDFQRNTPLHILLQNSHDIKIQQSPHTHRDHDYDYTRLGDSTLLFELLNLCCKYAKVVVDEEGGCDSFEYDLPWLVQNMEGNTPLHEALKANHILPLFSVDIGHDINIITRLSNKYKETPLHLLAGNSLVEWSQEVIEAATGVNKEAPTWKDKDGLTPILRAVQVGHIKTVKILDSLKPEASTDFDNDHRTIWHLLVNQPSSMTHDFVEYIDNLESKLSDNLKELLKETDKKGKTPLHLALESRSFTHARLFLQCVPDDRRKRSSAEELTKRLDFMKVLLEIKDGEGVTPGDLLASISDLPQHLQNLLKKYPNQLKGYRSVYGISTKEMNDYVNTMGVIAALLATISFTAAFTVPGGVIQDDRDKNVVGSPLLVDVIAFQAFMFFDISTMCLSTMVLFCLLWILAADTDRNSVMLMDSCILLLLISFYTTLLTFMAGVYVTTIHVKPWIAIYTLVICTTLLLLMHKSIVIKYIGPIGPMFSTFVQKFINSTFVQKFNSTFVQKYNKNQEHNNEEEKKDNAPTEAE